MEGCRSRGRERDRARDVVAAAAASSSPSSVASSSRICEVRRRSNALELLSVVVATRAHARTSEASLLDVNAARSAPHRPAVLEESALAMVLRDAKSAAVVGTVASSLSNSWTRAESADVVVLGDAASRSTAPVVGAIKSGFVRERRNRWRLRSNHKPRDVGVSGDDSGLSGVSRPPGR